MTCDLACIVLAKDTDDNYIVLPATKTEDEKTYAFNCSKITKDYTLFVAVKGDAKLDGIVDMYDATAVMLSWAYENGFDWIEEN